MRTGSRQHVERHHVGGESECAAAVQSLGAGSRVRVGWGSGTTCLALVRVAERPRRERGRLALIQTLQGGRRHGPLAGVTIAHGDGREIARVPRGSKHLLCVEGHQMREATAEAPAATRVVVVVRVATRIGAGAAVVVAAALCDALGLVAQRVFRVESRALLGRPLL